MTKEMCSEINDTNPDHNQNEKDKNLFIFVNRLKFDRSDGVKDVMHVDDIAKLVKINPDIAVVRRAHGDHGAGEPLTGKISIKSGDQFFVTRKKVEGGFTSRVEDELEKLRDSGQLVELAAGPTNYVIYRTLPTNLAAQPFTDVLIPIPNGYPAAMIDQAALPLGSPLIGRVKGAPQTILSFNNQSWQIISYHPHCGGGGPPWDPNAHGFHTYLQEILSWLGDVK